MSKSPALRATTAMISSGALPNVALRSPPTASPVRDATCSVARTMRLAMGMIASAAEKNTTGAETRPPCSSATATGMKTSSQSREGFGTRRVYVAPRVVRLVKVAQLFRRG